MTDQYVPALRRRFLEDMQIKGLLPKTQTMYLRVMREFTRFLGRSPDTATPEDLRAFQLDMKERGVGAPSFNNRLTVLKVRYIRAIGIFMKSPLTFGTNPEVISRRAEHVMLRSPTLNLDSPSWVKTHDPAAGFVPDRPAEPISLASHSG